MPDNTLYATGRRKQAIARVYLSHGKNTFTINGEEMPAYLKRANLQMLVEQPLKAAQVLGQFGIRAKVHGGGVAGQARAVRLGIARALLQYDEKLKSTLRQNGLLTRDPREKERKKPGRKGARQRCQYTKR